MQACHETLACGGNCALSTSDYGHKLWLCAESLSFEISRIVGPVNVEDFKNGADFSYLFKNRTYLVDSKLHGRLWLEMARSETEDSLLETLIPVLQRRIALQGENQFNPLAEILLWCALISGDIDTFSAAINSFPTTYQAPLCVLSSLLCQAARMLFPDGVKVLLQVGAPVNFNHPVHEALISCQLSTFKVRSRIFTSNTVDKYLTDVLNSLTDYGANLLSGGSSGWEIPLRYITILSRRGHIAASHCLIALTPADGINDHANKIFFDSPLRQVLNMMCRLYKSYELNSCFSVEEPSQASLYDVKNMIKCAVVPLLQAGAAAIPDPLSDNCEILILSSELFRASLAVQHRSFVLSSVVKVATEILLEARRKSSLNTEALIKCVATHLSFLNVDLPEEVYKYVDFIKSQYPRPLQSLCRLAIHRQLPIGLRSRTLAINSLQLPPSLSSYLLFEELNAID